MKNFKTNIYQKSISKSEKLRAEYLQAQKDSQRTFEQDEKQAETNREIRLNAPRFVLSTTLLKSFL